MAIIIVSLQLLLVPAVSPLCIGIIRKLKAKLQRRDGAKITQPYADLWKLFHKDETISKDASWIFRVAPIVVFGVTAVMAASIPLMAAFPTNLWTSDVLVFVYTMALGTFFLALAGMDTGGGFGGFGSSREMTVAALAEGGLVFSLLTVALISRTSNLFGIADAGMFSGVQSLLPVLLAFGGFFVVLLAETARFPFDNPSTHLELTMIHEAMILEYSGKKLALMEWAAANKLVIFSALAANLFFPWGIATVLSPTALLIGLGALFAKVLVCCIVIAVIESTMAKFRFFRLPDLLMISFILNAVAIGLMR